MAKKNKFSDDVFDENGLLRDGATMRVPMTLRDGRPNPNLTAMQRAVAAAKLADGGDPLSLHRPGHRILSRDNEGELTRDARMEALSAYDDQLTGAWRNPTRDDADYGYAAEGPEGSVCTVKSELYPDDFGSSGHIVNGICVPDDPFDPDSVSDSRKPVRDDRRAALLDYDRALRDAWRRGK